MTTSSFPNPATSDPFQPFPNVRRRNFMHAAIEVPLVVRLFGLPRGRRVLEVGCGRGVALPVLARRLQPRRLVGLDLDKNLLNEACRRLQRLGRHAELWQGDVRCLPFGDASFDVVVDFGTCYHITEPEQALREIERVLAPNGVFAHETRFNQLLGHPFRSFGRRMPWWAAPALRPRRLALMWGMRTRR